MNLQTLNKTQGTVLCVAVAEGLMPQDTYNTFVSKSSPYAFRNYRLQTRV